MTHHPRLFLAYLELALQQWLALRGFVLTLVVNQAVAPLIGLAVWVATLPGHVQISTYYVALLFVQLLTVSYENHTFSNRIYEGELADDLLRPLPVVLRPLAENIAIRVWFVILALPLLVVVMLLVPVQISAGAAVWFVAAILLAAFLRFLFTYTLALSAFWTERAHSAVGFGQTIIFLFGGGAAPLQLMPGWLHGLMFVLPFRAMYGFPAEVAAGWLSPLDILAGCVWQLAWIGLLSLAAAAAWRSGVRRYSVVGG